MKSIIRVTCHMRENVVDVSRAHRSQIRLLTIICLCMLSLFGTIYAAHSTMAAFQAFKQQQTQYQQGDVHSIRSWMTITYIAHTYHVPTSCLDQALNITGKREERDTLQTLASHRKRPVNELIISVQQAILAYRQDHAGFTPTSNIQKVGRNHW
jgi:hypothetical protein